MSWICVGCSEQEIDGSEVRGYGLCKACQMKARKANATLSRKSGANKPRRR